MFQCQILHCHVINDIILKTVEKRSKSRQFHVLYPCLGQMKCSKTMSGNVAVCKEQSRVMDKQKKLNNKMTPVSVILLMCSEVACFIYVVSLPFLISDWLLCSFVSCLSPDRNPFRKTSVTCCLTVSIVVLLAVLLLHVFVFLVYFRWSVSYEGKYNN